MNHEAHIQEFVGKYESRNRLARLLVGNFYASIHKVLPRDVSEVLEVGCGAGYSAQWIRPMLGKDAVYAASDIGTELVELARQRMPEIAFTVESVYDLPHEDSSKDLVICLETLEHLDDPGKALREILRVTRRYALLSVPREPLWRILNLCRGSYISELGNTPGHLNHWSTSGFKRFATASATLLACATPIPWTILLLGRK